VSWDGKPEKQLMSLISSPLPGKEKQTEGLFGASQGSVTRRRSFQAHLAGMVEAIRARVIFLPSLSLQGPHYGRDRL